MKLSKLIDQINDEFWIDEPTPKATKKQPKKDSSILIKNYQKNLTILEFASIKRVVFDSLLTSTAVNFEDLPTSIDEIIVDLKVKVIKGNK